MTSLTFHRCRGQLSLIGHQSRNYGKSFEYLRDLSIRVRDDTGPVMQVTSSPEYGASTKLT